MSVSEGLELTPFVNRCLALFFEVPEDPHDKLIREKSEYFVLRLKQNYEHEVREIIKDHAAQIGLDDVAKNREQDLIKFGELLQKTSAYPVFKVCLSRHDFDDDTLQIVTSEVNKMNGQKFEMMELWNRAVDWYRKYGEVSG